VIVRDWVRELGGDRKARRVVTLGSPHHGTKLAALGATFVPGACAVACEQLVPDSALLKQLNSGDETPAGPQWVSLWTSQDETVTPPDSAHLNGADNIVLQSICPGIAVTHSDLPRSPLVTGIVLASLQAGPVLPPTRADCAALSS
jgi:triacylglycerol esterase/lipase EstA (alpha/beta hydrolase family)